MLVHRHSTDDNVIQLDAGTRNARERSLHEPLEDSWGGHDTKGKASDLVQALHDVCGQHNYRLGSHRKLLVRMGQVQDTEDLVLLRLAQGFLRRRK